MSRRIIEETFRAITPRGRRGIPAAPPIAVGFSSGNSGGAAGAGSNGDLTSALSQAGAQIAQLKSSYQQQAALISANTQAIQSNTSAQGSHTGSAAGQAASSLLGGALGFLSPVISGIASLFGGGSSAPAPLPVYVPPAPVQISGSVFAGTTTAGTGAATPAQTGSSQAQVATPAAAAQGTAPQVTVNVNAMDSQSFMDRSTDIANAVREAMLNMHPINDVIANL